MEKRMILAIVLSIAIMLAWQQLFGPEPDKTPPPAAQRQEAAKAGTGDNAAGAAQPPARAVAQPPVAIAAALASIELVEEKYVDNAARMGDYLLSRLKDWPQRHPMVGEIRGKGLMVGIELVRDKVTKEQAGDERNHWVRLAFEKGLLVLGCGLNTLRLMPPLVVNRRQVDFAVDVLDHCLTELEQKHAAGLA